MDTWVKGKLRESDPVPKQIPMVLPEDLLQYLFHIGVEVSNTEAYWKHIKDVGLPWAAASNGEHIPVALYGDSAKYSASGEKITCIFMSIPLWNPKAARLSKWLLFALETDQILGGRTLFPFYRKIVESMRKLYFEGINLNGQQLKFVVTELKGDWEWHVYSMQMTRSWKNIQFCWRCKASKKMDDDGSSYLDFRDNPDWEASQYTQLGFLANIVATNRPGRACSLDASCHDHLKSHTRPSNLFLATLRPIDIIAPLPLHNDPSLQHAQCQLGHCPGCYRILFVSH